MRRFVTRLVLSAAIALGVLGPPAAIAQSPAQSASGSLTAAAAAPSACTTSSCVILGGPLVGQGQCWIGVDGTYTGTLQVWGSLTGVSFSQQTNITTYGLTPAASSITSTGLFAVPCAPETVVMMSAVTSGTAKVQIYATPATPYGGGAGSALSFTGIQPCPVTTTTATVCKTGAGVYYGVSNPLSAAQTGVTAIIYDSAIGCSGRVVDGIGVLGVTQKVSEVGGGQKYTYGLTICAASAPTAPGIYVFALP